MGNVMVIPAKRQVGDNIKKTEMPKLRVAAYCRVSTDSDEQATSYEAQIEHYTEFIQKNPGWVLAGIFADDGITGTNTKNRNEFNRMINECMAGNIDMIITNLQYYVEGDHEAIIPKDIFLLVQEELVRRRVIRTGADGKRRTYSCNHCFSQIVLCGECGEFYRRIHWNNRSCRSIVWRCCSRLENTGHACRSRTVNELLLQDKVLQAINQVLCKKDDFLKILQSNITTVVLQGDTLSPEVIDDRLAELQRELLKKANQKDDYDAIADEIFRLRDMRKQSEVDSVVKDEQMKQIGELQDFIKGQSTTITEFDETLVSRLIAKITVFEDHFTVDFKSGVTIDIEA